MVSIDKSARRPVNQSRRILLLRLTFLLLVPLMLMTRSVWTDVHWVFEVLENLGMFLIIGAVAGRFWSILYIGGHKNGAVMQDGPYSICRHPLYLSSTVGAVGFGLMMGSIVATTVIGVLIFLILQITAAREEAFLRQAFGPEYDSYATRVPRILPRPALFRTPATLTVHVGPLRRNAFDALVFLGLIPLAELLEGIKEGAAFPFIPLY